MRTDLLARLGEVDEGRAVRPLWSLVDRVNCKNLGMAESNLLSLSYGRIIRKEIEEVGGLRPDSYETYNIIEAGDTVLRMTDLQNDQRSIRTGLASERGIITSAYVSVRPRCATVEPRFLAAVLRAYDVKKIFYEMGAGVRQTLKFEELAHLPIPLPPREDQGRIADYLDRETTEIDAMDAELDRLVQTLQERRARAVENALLGDYQRVPLWAVTDDVIDCPHTTPAEDPDGPAEAVRTASVRGGRYLAGNGIVVSAKTAAERNGFYPPRLGDVFFTREAPAGEACLVPVGQFCLGQRMVLIRPNRASLDASYLVYAIYTRAVQDGFVHSAGGSTVANLKLGTIRSTRIPWPPLDEQRRIAAQLDEQTAQIDDMIAGANHLKALLAERRSTLIIEVVTGTKEVPA